MVQSDARAAAKPDKEVKMRLGGQARMGYYPLTSAEARRISRFLDFPDEECSVLDPCAGCGTALREITSQGKAVRYGIELDAYRADQSRRVLDHVIQGSCFDVHCPVESYSALYLTAPYDRLTSEYHRGERAEAAFLEQCFRWLKPTGVLVTVLLVSRLGTCSEVLAVHFRDKAIYRLTERKPCNTSE
jgi:hypothetical protein